MVKLQGGLQILREFLVASDPVDATDQICVVGKLILATDSGQDTDSEGRSVGMKSIFWNVQL